ncbi:MAG: PorT family protein [Flavobacteriales bacterium]|nr:PorT family protein [Flavobacteriales bacterium]
MHRITAFFCHAAILVGSVFSGQEAIAQWEVRVLAGGGAGQMRTDLNPTTSRGDYQVVDSRFSWLLGGSATHKLSGPLSFSTGLYWSFIAGHDEYWSRDVKTSAVDRQVHYLCLPMMVHVDFGRFRFGAGYQLATPLMESGTFYAYPYANGLGEYGTVETKELNLKPTDFGVVGELGFRIADRMEVGARYYYGLQNVKDPRDGYTSPLMNEQLVLTISYRILPKRKAKAEEAPVQEPVPAQ